MRKVLLPALMATLLAWPVQASAANTERGEYVFATGGCATCHTAEDGGAFLAGGHELKTDFGTFVTPNITPDPETGIGNWTLEDFTAAMRDGVSPEGHHYYPSFPYTSYVRMTDADIADLKAYLDAVPAVRNEVAGHDLSFPFNIRLAMFGWKLLFFDKDPFEPDPAQSQSWNRGAYLVNGPGHCGECHTPRNIIGVLDSDAALSGNRNGPEGQPVPGIRLGEGDPRGWSVDDIVSALQIGLLPDGDFMGGAMSDVIEDNTGKLTEEDLTAIATYLTSLPALDSNE